MHHDNSKGLNDFDQLFEIDEIGQCVLSNTCLKLKIENTVKTLSIFFGLSTIKRISTKNSNSSYDPNGNGNEDSKALRCYRLERFVVLLLFVCIQTWIIIIFSFSLFVVDKIFAVGHMI